MHQITPTQVVSKQLQILIFKIVANTTTKVNNQMAAGAPVKVNGLTVAQLKDGISRVQAFYKKYHRLPKYVKLRNQENSYCNIQEKHSISDLKISTTTTKTVPKINTSSVSALAKSLTAGSTTTSQSN